MNDREQFEIATKHLYRHPNDKSERYFSALRKRLGIRKASILVEKVAQAHEIMGAKVDKCQKRSYYRDQRQFRTITKFVNGPAYKWRIIT